MSIASLAGAASAGLPGKGAKKVERRYGLGFRFTVKFGSDQMKDLGAWHSCTGLKVDFKTIEVKKGGDYLTQAKLPDRAVYQPVQLKRAVLASESSRVQEWVSKAARDWMAGKESHGDTATVTLYDSNNKPVLEWVLHNARPAAWQGPDLDAKSSTVALETLTLDHEGFTVRAPGKPTAKGQAPGQPKLPVLTLTDQRTVGGQPVAKAGENEVKFQFAPETMTLDIVGKGMQGHPSSPTELHLSEVPSYKLSEMILHGPETMKRVRLLAKWAQAVKFDVKSKAGEEGDKPIAGDDALPQVRFEWGSQFKFLAQIKRLESKYTRFTDDGVPVRAVVGMTLEVVEDLSGDGSGGKNPSSGGIRGRASHVLVQSDSLPSLAGDHYGAPASWRDIAQANGIDDPLRTAPGRRIFLPARSELTEEPST